jgi:CRP-like cAMP-binding protein
MTDFLDEKKREIEARLKELRPLVDEYHRLEAAAAALDGVSTSSASTTAPARRARGAGAGSRRRGAGSSAGGRRGRPRGSGTRSKQALELVRSRPGISIPEMAEEMGIQQNYLYRVLPGLQKDGLVRKEGRGWHPLEAA